MPETDTITLKLTGEQARTLKSILHAIGKNFRRYPGMNIGGSQVHNLSASDIDLCFKMSDGIVTKLNQFDCP